MTGFLNQAERVWLMKQVANSSPQDPIGKLRRLYYTAYSGVLGVDEHAPGLSLDELETRWIMKYIDDNGGTVSDTDSSGDLWKKMVMAIGGTPSTYINENKLYFYTNAS